MENNDYVLEMKNISKEFPGVKALDEVSLKIRTGTVHALMGENGAGKSTLMKCAFGIYKPDGGEIFINGEHVDIHSSKDALEHGISMIHQELHPVKRRSVMENIWMGRIPVKSKGPFKFVDTKKMFKDTVELFKSIELNINPKAMVGDLSSSVVQQIEIARSLSYNAKVIIMDEPTSSLTEGETENLFKIIHALVAKGTSIIYISHKIEEILRISDDVTIMRDGKGIGSWPAAELTSDLIISRMVGRDMTNRYPQRHNEPGEVIMKVENYTSENPSSFQNVSFDLRKGEILGVGGLVGSQRTELMESIFAIRKISAGKLTISGKEVKMNSTADAIRNKMALLTEERRATGIFSVLSIAENTVVVNQKQYENKFRFLNNKKRQQDVEKYISALQIKTPSAKTWIQNLSGGNQQKVLLARWLLTEPNILILDEPTRGIDVGAKYEIYSIIADLAAHGKSIIMISSEMPELLGMSDRVMVMCEGHLSGILDHSEVTDEKIMQLASKYSA